MPRTSTSEITVRRATAADATTLHRLAALDSARPPAGDALIAVQDGQPVAALALADGRTVADPFTQTRDAVALLRTAATPASPARWRRRRSATARPIAVG